MAASVVLGTCRDVGASQTRADEADLAGTSASTTQLNTVGIRIAAAVVSSAEI